MCLLWSGDSSDCNTHPFSAFTLWDDCDSGQPSHRCLSYVHFLKALYIVSYIYISLSMSQIEEEVAKLLELKAQLGGDDGKHQFVLKTAKVSCTFKTTLKQSEQTESSLYRRIVQFFGGEITLKNKKGMKYSCFLTSFILISYLQVWWARFKKFNGPHMAPGP